MPTQPTASPSPNPADSHQVRPFRRAVFRGLAILMPPLLTVVLFIWAWSVIERYALVPVERISVWTYVATHRDVVREIPFADPQTDPRVSRDARGNIVSFTYKGRLYKPSSGRWVGYYPDEYVRQYILPRRVVLPAFLFGFLLILYLLGKFVAAGIGHMIVNSLENLVHRLPLVNKVYSSVKQVTDFIFSEREIEFNRVVAIEYPRKGIWSVGFVTGESMLDIRSAANEPLLSVLVPTSPMPMTGFTVTVLKSEALDLNLTVDQAIQFTVSCGVVVPTHQQVSSDRLALQLSSAIAHHSGSNGEKEPRAESRPQTNTHESTE